MLRPGISCDDWVLYKQQRLDDDGFMIVDKDVGNPRAINNEERAWNTECRAVAASDAEVVAAGEAIAAFVCR